MEKFKMPERAQDSNKGMFGRVLNVAGSENYTGAAYLSTYAAYKIGAGYVALASCDKVNDKVSGMLGEAVYLTRGEAKGKINNFTVLLIGCGLGLNVDSEKDFINFVTNSRIATVVDADGLSILSKTDVKLPERTVITPHPMEASRLLKTSVEEILSDTVAAAEKLNRKYGSTVVLKTHRTVVCDGDNIYVNNHGNSALAKAGTGDVLSGIIAGLLAQGMSSFEGAKLGVYLHSRAGEIASQTLTEYSVMASDIIKYLSFAITELL